MRMNMEELKAIQELSSQREEKLKKEIDTLRQEIKALKS